MSGSSLKLASPAVLTVFRRVMLAIATVIAVFWGFYYAVDPAYYDPLWLRGLMIAGGVVPALLTYAWVWSAWSIARTGAIYALAVSAVVTWLGTRNGLDGPWALGMCAGYVGSGLAVALYASSLRVLKGLVVAFVAVNTVALLAAWTPGVPAGIFLGYFVAYAGAFYLAGASRIAVMKRYRESRDTTLRSERLLQTLIDAIPDAVYVLDDERQFLTFNRAARGSFGGSADAAVGKTPDDLFPSDYAEDLRRWDREAMASDERLHRTEYDTVLPDGRELRVQATRVVIRDEDEGVHRLVCIVQNVTEQRRAEEELRMAKEAADEQRQLLRAIIDTIPDGIYVRDTAGRCVIVNRANADILGVDHPDQAVGLTVHDVLPAPLAAQVAAADEVVLKSGEASFDKETSYDAPSGKRRWRSATRVPLRGEGGEVIGVVGVVRDVTEQKAAEVRVREAKETAEEQRQMLRTLVDAIPYPVFFVDREGVFVTTNQAGAVGSGLSSPAEVVGKTAADLFPPDVAREIMETDQALMESGEAIYNYEHPFVAPDGAQRVFLATRVPLRSPDGDIVGLVGMSLDVTEQKRAEAELEAQRELLRTVIDTIPDHIYVKDIEGRATLRNVASARALGFSDPKLSVGYSDVEAVDSPFARDVKADDSLVIQRGESIIDKEERDHHGGWLLTTKVPLRDSLGEVVGLVGVSRDVTAQKEVEQALVEAKEAAEDRGRELAEQQETLQSLFDAIPDAIFVADIDDRFVAVNAGTMAYLPGRERGDVVGKARSEVLPPEVATAYRTYDDEAIASGERVHRMENRYVREDGDVVTLETTRVVIRNEGGEPDRVVGVARDVTAQKKAERALVEAKDAAEASTRAKSEFLANMSHEIRTPMNGVIGMTSLLLETELGAEQREFVETIRTSGDALLTLINDILDFSKIEAGRLDLEVAPFDVRACIEDALDLVARSAAEKGVDVAYLVAEDVPNALRGDATRVRQVLVNMLSNAVKFTDEGSVCVRVGVKPSTGGLGAVRLRVAVEDTGIGIAEDKVDHVFGSFTQADASTTRRFGGTGLGLAISKRLVEMMGGEIGAESEPGVGSTFAFEIPATVAVGMPRTPPRPGPAALEGRRALIVDDNEVTREVAATLVQRWSVAAVAVDGGPSALDAVARAEAAGQPFDVVVLDMQMPEMDGLAVAEALAARPAPAGTARPAILLLTSILCGRMFREQALATGVHTVLYKPMKAPALFEAISEATAPPDGGGTAETPTMIVRAKKEPAPTASGIRILLAEDNAVNQKVALRMLDRLGHAADVAADGVEVLEALARQPYDVILMDVQMPRMGGLDATRRVRADLAAEDQPYILALTANAMQGDRERCLEAGCDDYLTKPVNLAALRDALAAAPASRPALAPGASAEPAV